MQALLDHGISTRRGVMNIHLEGAYSDQSSHRAATSLMRSVSAQQQTIILPLYVQMTESDIARVVEALRGSLAEAINGRPILQHDRDVALA
jgi:dTDP-4-amino-4,6-dideoxygalactose transaminase